MAASTDELRLTIGGTEITGWETIETTLRLEAFPNSFTIGMSAKDPVPTIVKPGAACTVSLGSDKVITGYVDRERPGASSDAHSINVVGRGKTLDLVDCSAELDPTGQMLDVDALLIARKLAQPYGIEVRLGDGAEAGPRIAQFVLNYGETGAAIIQRYARNAGLLAYEAADGALVLGKVGTRKAASGAAYGENVLDYVVDNSMDGRFSEIVCAGFSSNVLGDLGDTAQGPFFFTAKDPNVPRHRLRYLVAEPVAENREEFAKKRALWEAARAAGRGAAVTATVDSWRDKDGKLWTPNTILPVDVPGNRGDKNLVLGEVTFRKDNSTGTTARLTLMPAAAFAPEPIVVVPVNVADLKGPGQS